MGLLWCLLSVTASFGNRREELPNGGCDDVQIRLIINTEPPGEARGGLQNQGELTCETRQDGQRGVAWSEVGPSTSLSIYTLQHRRPFIAPGR